MTDQAVLEALQGLQAEISSIRAEVSGTGKGAYAPRTAYTPKIRADGKAFTPVKAVAKTAGEAKTVRIYPVGGTFDNEPIVANVKIGYIHGNGQVNFNNVDKDSKNFMAFVKANWQSKLDRSRLFPVTLHQSKHSGETCYYIRLGRKAAVYAGKPKQGDGIC